MIDLALIDLTPNSQEVIGAAHWWSSNTGGELHLLQDLSPNLPALASEDVRDHWFREKVERAMHSAQMMADAAVGTMTFFPIHTSSNQLIRGSTAA